VTGSDELSAFVKEALGRSVPRDQIEDVLLRAGWNSQQIRAAMMGFAAVDFPIPVPRPRPSLSARDAFMYLVLFSALYVSAYNLGSLLFQFINQAFPDPAYSGFAERPDYVHDAIRWNIASLIVPFPVFLYVSWLTSRAIRKDPNKRRSAVRRWLTYLTLFIAAAVIIGDLIALVYNLLGGELTTRFVSKVAVVGIISGSAFWYYLSDLRPEEREADA